MFDHILLYILENKGHLADEMAFRDLSKKYKKEKYGYRSTLPPRQKFALPWVPEVIFWWQEGNMFLTIQNKITSGTQGIKLQT